MLLWDIIRDWFVQYIFGGSIIDSEGVITTYNTGLGAVFAFINGEYDDYYFGVLNDVGVKLPYNSAVDGGFIYVSLADWLSTTATLIVMASICVGLFFLVRYFFRMFAGLISGR